MKSKWILAALLFLSAVTQAQHIAKLYDIGWKETTIELARYTSDIRQTDSGWLRHDYYLPSATLQMRGLYKDSACTIENGAFYYVYPDGKIESMGSYLDKNKNGLWISYHPNGYKRDSIVYDNGIKTGTTLHWHNTGFLSDSVVLSDKGAVMASWYDDGSVSSVGRLSKANQPIGVWKFFHRNGNKSAEELYTNGKMIQKLYYDEQGLPSTDTSTQSMPATFKGGVEGWLEYLKSHLIWPTGYRLVNTNKVSIGVQFRIDETGSVKDVFLFAPFNKVFDDIVRRTFGKSPKWTPSMSHNRKVSYSHKQVVIFAQQ